MERETRNRWLTRRNFLRAAGVTGLACAIEACTPKSTPTPTPAPVPTSVPTPTKLAPTLVPTAAPLPGSPKAGGTLVVYQPESPYGLDPHIHVGTTAGQRLSPMMYDCLVTWGPDLELIPQIAESWEMIDERTFVFKLRKGVRFHNGREVTVDDVKYSFDRIMDPNTGAEGRDFVSNVDSVAPVDSGSIQFKLKDPDMYMPYTLYWGYIVPQEVQDQPKDFLSRTVIGTGPFTLDSFKPDVETRLVRNPYYWKQGLPYLDGIDIPIIPEEATAIAALRAGDVQQVTLEDNNNFELLKRIPNIDLALTSYNGEYFNNFNGDKPPLDDLKVRQAMSQALDREEFVKVVGAGLGTVCGFVPPVFADFFVPPEELPYYDYNPDKARQLLRESTVPDGFKMDVIYVPGWANGKPSAELFKRYWEDIGIEIELRPMEVGLVDDTMINDKPWYFFVNMHMKHPVPEGIYDTHLRCGIMLSDFFGPCSPEVDDLVTQAKAAANLEKRKALLRQAQIEVAAFVPTIVTFAPLNVDAVHKRVKGFQAWPDKAHRGWEYVWLDK